MVVITMKEEDEEGEKIGEKLGFQGNFTFDCITRKTRA